MTNTTPTSGAADLPEALRRSTAADGKTELFNLPGYPLMVRAVDFNRIHTESEMRRTALLDEMQKAALAAGQATAAQAVVQDDLITIRKPTTSAEMLWLLKLAHLVISDVGKTLEAPFAPAQPVAEPSRFGSPELQAMIIARCVEKDQADSVQAAPVGAVESNTADAAPTQGATEMENLQRTAVGWQGRALRAERNWAVCRRWAIAGGAPVEKLGDDPDQPFHAASPAIDGESNG